ncbi:MAG: hypothetical protein U5L46_02650 [Agrobacterium sp.]|nr:hypothetical protein [Agrobacterium sp.]
MVLAHHSRPIRPRRRPSRRRSARRHRSRAGSSCISTVITLLGGTMFLMWLGEQITERGIGNGISLIIFAGIVAGLPSALAGTLELGRTGALSTRLILMVIIVAIARHRASSSSWSAPSGAC